MNKPTSIYLDLIIFLAALTVFIVHANYERFTGGLPLLWRFGDLGNDAVMVFFVLSGFVIAYVCDQKEKTLKEYFASRFARLYSVAIPALLLTVLLDFFGSRFNYSLYAGPWFESDNPAWRLLANLLFINELWFSSVRPFTNGPFWSLGYEFWYYVIFAIACFTQGYRRYIFICFIFLLVGPKIIILFPVWLLGVFAYRIVKRQSLKPKIGWPLFLLPIVAYVIFRQSNAPQALLDITINLLGEHFVNEELKWSRHFLSSYITGILIAANFIGAAIVSDKIGKLIMPLEYPIRHLACFTFAIYLFHYPCLQFFSVLASALPNSSFRILFIIGGTILVIWVLGALTEARKGDLRRWILLAANTITRNLSVRAK